MPIAHAAQLSSAQLRRLTQDMVVRDWVLDQLEGWLGENHEASPIFLITGTPGAGKTAFMAHLMMLLGGDPIEPAVSDIARDSKRPALAETTLLLSHFCDPTNERSLDPLNFVTSLSEKLATKVPGFAEALVNSVSGTMINIESVVKVAGDVHGGEIAGVKIAPLRDLPTRQAFASLVRRPLESVAGDGLPKLLVLVDDLSSAYRFDSSDNLGSLLGVVADNPAELSPSLRFVVTSRAERWVLKDLPAAALDLVDDRPSEGDDLYSYVEKRLAGAPPKHRFEWIDQVSGRAAGNFLYARYVLDQLLADPALFQAGIDLNLPTGLPELYAEWVGRALIRDRNWWRQGLEPVLTLLAAACGDGLTLEELASITGLPASKVRHAVEDCEQFLVGRPGGPVRIYHESFREYLVRDHVELREGDEAILAFFRQQEPGDWSSATSEYALNYLATHAAALDRLPELLNDPGFMIAADPAGLRPHLASLGEESRPASAYLRASGGLITDDIAERASHVQLAALEMGFVDLATAVDALSIDRRWIPLWTSLLRQRVSVTVGRLPGGVVDFLTTRAEDLRAWVVALSRTGEIVAWEVATQAELVRLRVTDQSYPFERLAWCADLAADMFAITSAGVIVLVDARTGGMIRPLGDRSPALVTAVASAQLEDRQVLVAGYTDGVLAAYELDGSLAYEQVRAHDSLITDVKGIGGQVISAAADGLVYVWNVGPERLEAIAQLQGADGPWVTSCAALVDVDDWLCAGVSDGSVVWASSRAEFFMKWVDVHRTAAWKVGYDAVGTDGSWTQTVTTNSGEADLASVVRAQLESARRDVEFAGRGTDAGSVVNGGEDSLAVEVPSVIRLNGGVNGVDLFRVSESVLLATAGEDGAVRIFDVGESGVEETLVPIGPALAGVQLTSGEGWTAVVAAEREGGGVVRAWQLSDGPGLLPAEVGDLDALVLHLAAASAPEKSPVAAAALSDGTVLLFDAVTGSELTRRTVEHDTLLRGATVCSWANSWLIAAYGARTIDGADTDPTSLGVVHLWPQWEDQAATLVEVELPGLVDVLGLVMWDDRLLVTGEPRADHPPVWSLRRVGTNWEGTPCPLGTAESVELNGAVEALGVLTTATGASLVVRDYIDVYEISLPSWETRLGDFTPFGDALQPVVYASQLCFLGGDTVLELTNSDGEVVLTFVDDTSDGKLIAVAGLPDLSLVVAGRDNGRLSFWRTPGQVEQVIQLGSDARQILLCPLQIVLVRTELGIYSLLLNF